MYELNIECNDNICSDNFLFMVNVYHKGNLVFTACFNKKCSIKLCKYFRYKLVVIPCDKCVCPECYLTRVNLKNKNRYHFCFNKCDISSKIIKITDLNYPGLKIERGVINLWQDHMK